MKNVVTCLCVALLATTCLGAIGDVHDSRTDFSSTNNPNGPWSYHVGQAFGAAAFDFLSAAYLSDFGNCWAPDPADPNSAGAPFSRHCDAPGPPIGPVAAAFGAVQSFNGHTPYMSRYTVPAGIDALAVLLNYHQSNEPTRQMRLIIKQNGTDKMVMDAIQPVANGQGVWTEPNAVSFNVAEGDEIDFVVDGFGTLSASPGTGTTSGAVFAVKEIAQLPVFTLNVSANPANITTVTNIGTSDQPINQLINMVASDYEGCLFNDGNTVYTFDSWTGPVADAGSANTTVFESTAGATVSVTANYVVISVCGDACHPFPDMDFNEDCLTDFNDFTTFAGDWLTCTQPVCID